jgi:N-acetylmuramoyl-L-alanine amidase
MRTTMSTRFTIERLPTGHIDRRNGSILNIIVGQAGWTMLGDIAGAGGRAPPEPRHVGDFMIGFSHFLRSRRRRGGTVAAIALALLVVAGARDHTLAQPPRTEAKASLAACNRAEFRVIVDVGHTAEVPGATSARGQWEYDFNLRLAKLIDQKLLESGFQKAALLITKGKSRKGLVERVAHANKSSADLFLSIHHDSVPDKFLEKWHFGGKDRGYSDRFKGHSIFISHANSDVKGSLLFARLLGQQLKARDLHYTPHYTEKFMGHRQRLLVDADAGVYRYDQLIVLKDTRMPAVLLEAGSIINRDEELVMESPERQSLISAAVLDAVDNFCAARQQRYAEKASRPALASTSRPFFVSTPQPASLSRQR